MKNVKFIFPNTLTLFNLISGCGAIIVAFKGKNEYNAALLILLAAVFDFLDGLVARALNARSEFGKQLDSLADIVSFGVAPSVLLFNWFYLVLIELSADSTFELISANFSQNLILFCSLLFAASASVRLARFNIMADQGRHFKGLPTPAAALIIAALWLMLGSTENKAVKDLILNIYFVFGVLIVLIFLMLSKIRMLSLKFKGISFKTNLFQYILVVASVILIIRFRVTGILFSLVFYVFLSLVSFPFIKTNT
ncbi:MAG: CDP-alcohol phosphatidyltransferase family protein [Bacteroidales bacterium]|jgi:CDP-diacylglycerol--serine O-phosphatidyltransferase